MVHGEKKSVKYIAAGLSPGALCDLVTHLNGSEFPNRCVRP